AVAFERSMGIRLSLMFFDVPRLIPCSCRTVQHDVPTFMRQNVELPTRNAMGRKDLSRTDPCKPANALVGVMPTHTSLSLQCLGDKLIAFLCSSPSFLQNGWRIGSAEARRLIFRYVPLWWVVLRRVIGFTLHTRSKPTRQEFDETHL